MGEQCAYCGGQTEETLLQGFVVGDSLSVPIGRTCTSCDRVALPAGLDAPVGYEPAPLSTSSPS